MVVTHVVREVAKRKVRVVAKAQYIPELNCVNALKRHRRKVRGEINFPSRTKSVVFREGFWFILC